MAFLADFTTLGIFPSQVLTALGIFPCTLLTEVHQLLLLGLYKLRLRLGELALDHGQQFVAAGLLLAVVCPARRCRLDAGARESVLSAAGPVSAWGRHIFPNIERVGRGGAGTQTSAKKKEDSERATVGLYRLGWR